MKQTNLPNNAHIHRLNKDPAYRLNSQSKIPNRYIHQRGNDTPAGMYLELMHGRRDPDQDMEDWGDTCDQIFGPIHAVIHTYNSTTRVVFDQDYRHELWLSDTIPARDIINELHHQVLAGFDDMLYYDGMYYGDWCFFHHAGGKA